MFEQPATAPSLTRAELEVKHLAELHELASASGVPRFMTLRRPELIEAIAVTASGSGYVPGPEEVQVEEAKAPEPATDFRVGVLDLVPDGFGFMRVEGLGRSDRDVYVSRSQIRALDLRSGDELAGPVRPAGRSDRYPSLAEVGTVNGALSDELPSERPRFAELTPIGPSERLPLASDGNALAARMVDLLAPLAKGQRCLIAGAPGGGATRLLCELAQAVVDAGEVVPLVVIVDARPEEVTDWERAVAVPVYSSPPDRSPEAHVRLAELALERSKRIVEQGDDVVVLLDSITRLARAGSLLRPRSRRDALEGETVEGEGLEVAAARFVKRWFSTARTAEQGGSLTIVATVHVESGLTLEETVYGALADSANLELRLDHELSLAGRFPALDVNRCWSRDEAAVIGEDELHRLRTLRDWLRPLSPADAWDAVVEKVRGA